MGPGPGAGALPGGRGRRPPPRAAPRAHLGSVAITAEWSAAREGAAERATAAATAPAAASTAAAAGGGRKETLASQWARLGQTRGTWGGAGFGPAWGRMVNLEPMHTGEGRREGALTGVSAGELGRRRRAPFLGVLFPSDRERAVWIAGHPGAGTGGWMLGGEDPGKEWRWERGGVRAGGGGLPSLPIWRVADVWDLGALSACSLAEVALFTDCRRMAHSASQGCGPGSA